VSTGVKIAIGCAVAVVLAGIVALVALGGAVWWAKGKVESVAQQVTGEQEQIEALQKQANANAFVRPADGLLHEPRLLKFLQVRRDVFSVYERHKDEFEAASSKQQPELVGLVKGLSVINEVRLAQAKALAQAGMSEDEYRYMVETVYKTLWASAMAEASEGKSVSEATAEGMDQAAQALAKSQEALEGAPPEVRDQMKGLIEQMHKSAAEATENAQTLDVPPANIELFRKYEGEIKKYAMGGLELIGL